MLKELYELWRRDNFMNQALDESYVMLENTFDMFKKSVHSLRKSDSGKIAMDVYEKDKEVNAYLEDVRRKVFKHLALTGGANTIPGLVLTSIVIDVERIGDYTKNITDLAVAHPKRLHCAHFEESIQRIEKSVIEMFGKVIPCLKTSDKEAGSAIMKNYHGITAECEGLVMKLIKEEHAGLPSTIAVTTALYVRHLKRITAHLLNIASSVVNPFEKVGFPEPKDE